MSLEKDKKTFKNILDSVIIAFVMAMIIRTLLFSTYQIPTGSMISTILPGDFIIGNKLAYHFKKPVFGDIAIFEYPVNPSLKFVKRVIGEPGDEIEIINKVVYRNGKVLDEPYKHVTSQHIVINGVDFDNVPKFKIPEGMYFMLGDNRDNSADSREWGFVPLSSFQAKAWMIYFSKEPGNFLSGIRWNRMVTFF